MKTRQSLVSNSSSSSFICHAPIGEVATKMWKIFCVEQSMTMTKKNKQILSNIKKICKKENVQTGEYGIYLPTDYESTHILVRNEKCYVQTCNNIDWSELNTCRELDEEGFYEIIKNKYFYIASEKNLLLKHDNECLPTNSKIDLVCPKCEKKWGKQDRDAIIHNDFYYIDIDKKKYCSVHLCEIREEKRTKIYE